MNGDEAVEAYDRLMESKRQKALANASLPPSNGAPHPQ
jgi:hypothetical protein